MTEGYSYALSMKDEMSSPAKAMKDSLAHLKDQLKATEASVKALKDAQTRFKTGGLKDEVKASSDAIAKMREKSSGLKDQIKETNQAIKETTPAVDETKESMTGAGLAAGAMVAAVDIGKEIFRKIGEAAKWAAEQLIHWTIAAAKVAIEAGAMKEKLVAMYDYFGAGKGKEIFAQLDALGTAIHVPTEKVHEYAKDLITSGIEGQNRIEQTVKTVAMLQKVAGDDAANKIKGIIEESAKTQKTQFWKGGRGTFSITREQLVGTGVTIDQVYAALAKRTKLGVAQVRTQMMMGQITAAQGIDALNDVIERGKVGEVARNMVGGLDQAITELKDNFAKLLKDVDYKGFIKEVSGFAKLLDPLQSSGKLTKSVLTDVFNKLFDVAKKTVHGIRIAFLDLQIAGLELLLYLGPQIKQFKELWQQMQKSTTVAMIAKAAWWELKGAFMFAAYGIKLVLQYINGTMVAINLLDKAIEGISNIGASLAERLNMKGLGSSLIKDLIAGIKANMPDVKNAAGEVGGALKSGFKDAIGWHSPPKFFLEAGKAANDAFVQGSDNGGAPGAFAKQSVPVAPQGGAGARGNVTIQVDVEINGVKGVEDAVDMFRSKLTDALEQIADELGGKLGAA